MARAFRVQLREIRRSLRSFYKKIGGSVRELGFTPVSNLEFEEMDEFIVANGYLRDKDANRILQEIRWLRGHLESSSSYRKLYLEKVESAAVPTPSLEPNNDVFGADMLDGIDTLRLRRRERPLEHNFNPILEMERERERELRQALDRIGTRYQETLERMARPPVFIAGDMIPPVGNARIVGLEVPPVEIRANQELTITRDENGQERIIAVDGVPMPDGEDMPF